MTFDVVCTQFYDSSNHSADILCCSSIEVCTCYIFWLLPLSTHNTLLPPFYSSLFLVFDKDKMDTGTGLREFLWYHSIQRWIANSSVSVSESVKILFAKYVSATDVPPVQRCLDKNPVFQVKVEIYPKINLDTLFMKWFLLSRLNSDTKFNRQIHDTST